MDEFTEDHEKELRERFRKLADAPTDELRDMASAMHMGIMVTAMVESLVVAEDRMKQDGIPANYKPMAVNQVTYKVTGKPYQISVREACDEEVQEFVEACANASPLEEGITRH